MKRVIACCLVTMFALVVFAPGAQARASGRGDIIAVQLSNVAVPGGGTLAGHLQITGFATSSDGVVALAKIEGVVTYPSGATIVLNETVTVPLTQITAGCGQLLMTLGPTATSVGTIELSAVVVEHSIVNAPPKLLCALGKANAKGDEAAVAALLDQLV